jgi:CubicO group peptidase (beta-lactamase class C family)
MTSSTVEQPLPAGWPSRTAPAVDSSPDAAFPPFEVIDGAPAGGLTTTASDMARLVASMLGNETLLRRATWERMWQPAWGPQATLGNRADQTGLGFARFEYAGHAGLDHLGSTGSFMSDLRLFPDPGIG